MVNFRLTFPIQDELSHIPITAQINIYFEKGIYAIGEDFPIPSGLSLNFSGTEGAILDIYQNKKIIINSNIIAGEYQIFSGSGSVVFGPNNFTEARPQWWKNFIEDRYIIAIQEALASHAKVVYFFSGTYDCPQYIDAHSKKGVAVESIVLGNKCDSRKIDFFYLRKISRSVCIDQ